MKNKFLEGYRQYTKESARLWDPLTEWNARMRKEKNFFAKILKRNKAHKVLDIACGTGFHTIDLLKKGFDVVSIDGSPDMLNIAKKNARIYGVKINAKRLTWDKLGRIRDKFDAVICLGNSYSHIFGKKKQEALIKNVRNLLNDGGLFILDSKNYDKLLDKGFSRSYYFINGIRVSRMRITSKIYSAIITIPNKKGKFVFYNYPNRQSHILCLLKKAGFSKISCYGDFRAGYKKYEPNFLQFAANK